MNTKQLITGTIAAMVLMTAWYLSVYWIRTTKPHWVLDPKPPATQSTPLAQTQPTDPATTAPPATATAPSTQQGPERVAATAPTAGLRAVPTSDAPAGAPVDLGSANKNDPAFAMQLTLNPRGAGIDQVALNDFSRAVKDERPYVFQAPYEGHASATRSLATRWISINGQSVDLSNVEWALRKQDGTSATYSVDIVSAEGPVARVIKTFTLPRRDTPGKGLGFEVGVDYRIENLSGQPLKVKTEFNGPTVPPQELAQGDRLVLSGQKEGATIVPHQHLLDVFTADEPSKELLVDDDGRPAYWAGAASAYFNAILQPLNPAAPKQPADYLESIKADRLDPQAQGDTRHRKVAITFRTKELEVKAGESLTLPLTAYFGPRKRSVLSDAYYASLPRNYYSTLVIASGPCWFCTFDWLVVLLVSMLGFFHDWIWRDWGLAIITLVVIVRTILHPITKKSQVNMMKMGKMGPEIEKLKKKHGDNKDELNKAMMQFYKTQGATPILGCLPMFLQMPIWIALWSALQSTFELRHEPFLYGSTWIDDLSKPDALLSFAQPIRLFFGITIGGLNLLPILLAGVFWLNQKYTPKPPATSPEMEQQQKIMQWMVLLFPLMMYSMPSGLLLYIFASTSIGIVESKVVRDHIKKREELEKLQGPVIIDAPPTRASRRKDRGDEGGSGAKRNRGPEKPTPGGWLGRKLAELQEKAEAVKREAERKGR